MGSWDAYDCPQRGHGRSPRGCRGLLWGAGVFAEANTPARLRGGTRIEHIAPTAHKTKPPELIQRFICRGNVGLRKLSPTYGTDFKYPRLHGLLRRR
jgi:hypothetical protein